LLDVIDKFLIILALAIVYWEVPATRFAAEDVNLKHGKFGNLWKIISSAWLMI
jgi:hypothetical protein